MNVAADPVVKDVNVSRSISAEKMSDRETAVASERVLETGDTVSLSGTAAPDERCQLADAAVEIPAICTENGALLAESSDDNEDGEDDFSPARAHGAVTPRREARTDTYTSRTNHLLCTRPYLRRLPLMPMFEGLSNAFSYEATTALGLTYFLVKGMTAHTVSASTLPMFKDVLQVSSGEYQVYVRIGVLGWAMKPLVGVISDQVTFFQYHKRFYLVWACILGAVAANVWALLPGEPSFAAVAACCTFFLYATCALPL